MKKHRMITAGMLCLMTVFMFTESVSATEIQGESVEQDNTEQVSTEQMSAVGNTDATFHLSLTPVEGFNDEIEFLFISESGEYEYDIALNEENAYTASFTAKGNTTYQLWYYYESYEAYEIEELKEEYVCESGTLWNLNYNIIERINPVEKELYPIGGDMTEEEVEQMEKERFVSSDFPNMTDADVVEWYYGEVKRIVSQNEKEGAFTAITSGIGNDTTKEFFRHNSGTEEEWENMSDEQMIAFYYACVLPNIIIGSDDFDFDNYINKLDILNTLCNDIGCEELYDNTYKLWEYIWQYQRSERELPNFSTYLITEFRAEVLTEQTAEGNEKTADIESADMEETDEMNILVKYLKEHWFSLVCFVFGSAVLGVFYYKRKKEEKGKVKR